MRLSWFLVTLLFVVGGIALTSGLFGETSKEVRLLSQEEMAILQGGYCYDIVSIPMSGQPPVCDQYTIPNGCDRFYGTVDYGTEYCTSGTQYAYCQDQVVGKRYYHWRCVDGIYLLCETMGYMDGEKKDVTNYGGKCTSS